MSAHCSAWRLCRQNYPRLKKRMPRAPAASARALPLTLEAEDLLSRVKLPYRE
jgi:hypothetical protein